MIEGKAPDCQHHGSMIDVHAHLGCPGAFALYSKLTGKAPPRLGFTCPHTDSVNAQMFAAIGPMLNAIDLRIAEMDRLGVALQVLSPNPAQFFYDADAEVTRQTAQAINDDLAEATARHPGRFAALGTVPLQDTGLAIAEMRRAVRDLGFKGIEVGTYVAGRELSDESLRPFLAEAEALDCVLFVHPLGFSHGERLSRHYLNNILGNPIESTIALANLIFDGVFDQFPALKWLVAHGGGYLPAYWGRMDHAWKVREDCRSDLAEPPSAHLRRIWTDSLVFDRAELAQLLAAHGASRVCLGTDFPFDMAEADPQGFLAAPCEADRLKVARLNATELFGL